MLLQILQCHNETYKKRLKRKFYTVLGVIKVIALEFRNFFYKDLQFQSTFLTLAEYRVFSV